MDSLRLIAVTAALALGCGGDDGTTEEPDAGGGTDIVTAAVAPTDGANSVDLGTVGVDFLTGTTLEFDYSVAAGIVTFATFGVTAGPTGAQIRGPSVILVVAATERPDPADRFASLLLTLDPNEPGVISDTSVDFAHAANEILGGSSVQLIFGFAEAAPNP
jgi:hypothetical protein